MQKGFVPLLIIIGIALILGIAGGAYFLGQNKSSSSTPSKAENVSQEENSQPNDSSENSSQASDSTKNLKKIPLVSTEGWKSVRLNGVTFKISPTQKCNDDNSCSLIFPPPPSILPIKITITDYKVGSRRDQYFSKGLTDCHWKIEEAMFGEIVALQIGAEAGWCQGGGGAIVAVVGNKFVEFEDLFWDPKTGDYMRWDIRDTIISTLKASTTQSTKTINYNLPPGWKTVQSADGVFEVGYDPNVYYSGPSSYQGGVSMSSSTSCCYTFYINVKPYDGGSRHKFLDPNGYSKTAETYEKEYKVNGKSSLFLYNVDASSTTIMGMLVIDTTRALFFAFSSSDEEFVEKTLASVKILK